MNTPSLSEKTTSSPPPKLLDQVVAKIRFKHYSRRTEQSYSHWIKRYILFHGKRHPKEMGAPEIEVFLSALATDRNVRDPAFHHRKLTATKLPVINDGNGSI